MFNQRIREKNILRISLISAGLSIGNLLLQFVYRTFFLAFLSKEYLGIEGLFTNILQVLSLAELGIGTIIGYRLYQPIKECNSKQAGKLLYFYRMIYRGVAVGILCAGLLILPFLDVLIHDISEIPKDVNLRHVYLLFLSQTVSSYFFSYKQTIMSADQRNDSNVIFAFFVTLFRLVLQVFSLALYGDYERMLFLSIVINIVCNALYSRYICKQYSEVFQIQEGISKEEKKQIFYEVRVMLCHKIGGTVLNSTDNIILSAYIGLGQLGKYANYSLLTGSVQKLFGQLLGNFTASLGNAHISLSASQRYDLYSRLLNVNFILANIATVMLYTLLTPFIRVWQGQDMLLGDGAKIWIIACFYVNVARVINTSYINASGLFTKDALRPLIEAFFNLIISVFLVKRVGISGVFAGTIFSHIVTVGWREPYLLYRYVFKKKVIEYWGKYIKNLIAIIIECLIACRVIELYSIGYTGLIRSGIVVLVITLLIILIIDCMEIADLSKWVIGLRKGKQEENGNGETRENTV